jgi:hypothetical protein
MFFPLLPLDESFGTLDRLFKEISSNFWDSSVVEDRELESPDVLNESFLDPNLDLQLDLPFSGGATTGTVRLLARGAGSKEIDDVIGSILGWLSVREAKESGEKGGSPAEFEPPRESDGLWGSNVVPSMEANDAMFSDGESSVAGVSWYPGEFGDGRAWDIDRDRSAEADSRNGGRWLGADDSASCNRWPPAARKFPYPELKFKPVSFGGASWNCVGKCRSTLIVSAEGFRGSKRFQVCLAREISRAILTSSPQSGHFDWGGRLNSGTSSGSH